MPAAIGRFEHRAVFADRPAQPRAKEENILEPRCLAIKLLGPVLAASIIFKLEPKISSAILTEMKPTDAAKIATVLTSAVEANGAESK